MVSVKIGDGKRSTYLFRKDLKIKGFRFQAKSEACWTGEVPEAELNELEDWCFSRKLRLETPFTTRSNDYRKAFFEYYHPNAGRSRYFCAYCGFPVREATVTVDHLVSVKRAQRSRYYLNLLRKWGCESVNDVRNLVPCCRHCNSRKGTKAHLWVLRGLAGRNKTFWHVVWFLRGTLFVGVLCAVIGCLA